MLCAAPVRDHLLDFGNLGRVAVLAYIWEAGLIAAFIAVLNLKKFRPPGEGRSVFGFHLLLPGR
jgi:hypothetical protein